MDRQQAHELLDKLDPKQLDAVAELLTVMVLDDGDEELTAEDSAAIQASLEYFQENPEGGVPFEQVVADLGFTMEQVRGPQKASRK